MDMITLAAARKYVNDTANALGAVKGSPCTIKSITETDDGATVVFSWTGADGVEHTSSTFLPRGPKGKEGDPGEPGNSPDVDVAAIDGGHRVTITDATGTHTFDVLDGKPGKDGSGTVDTVAREQITALTEELDGNLGVVKYDNSQTPYYGTYYIMSTDGSTVETQSGRATDYIDIESSVGGELTCSLMLYEDYGLAFYDEDKAFVSGIGGNTSGYRSSLSTQTISVRIPDNAKYVRMCMYGQNYSNIESFGISLRAVGGYENYLIKKVNEAVDDGINQNSEYDASKTPVVTACGINAATGVEVLTGAWVSTDFINVYGAKDNIIQIAATLYDTYGVAFYDINRKYVSGISGNSEGYVSDFNPQTLTIQIPSGVRYVRSCMLKDRYQAPESFNVAFEQTGALMMQAYEYTDHYLSRVGYKMLVLGDSFSSMGYWIDGMKTLIEIVDLVNLGVTSATVCDAQQDREQYPYTDRPTSSGTGNQNTLASQVQKLKRLMAGTDLDEGETKLYDGYTPNIIIIEGGMNDWYDTDEQEQAYGEAFLVEKQNVYVKNSAGAVEQGNIFVKTDIEEVDRTTFAGAYRYIVEELSTLFPDAQIFITTACRFNYFRTNPQIYDKIAEQQIKCARLCAASVIDWNGEGNLNTIVNCPNGSGTEADPYTVYGGTLDTTDGLHPNPRGGYIYGRLAAKVIMQRFVDIGT